MAEINTVAVLVTTVVAFVLSAIYYGILGDQLATVSQSAQAGSHTPLLVVVTEVVRSLVVVTVVAGLASSTDADGWRDGVVLGLALWVGFPVVLWAGAMLHERTPGKLAAIHAGDWLIKLVIVASIISVWQEPRATAQVISPPTACSTC